MLDSDADYCANQSYIKGLADGKRQGSAEERARIVAFVREYGGECLGGHRRCIDTIQADMASDIERGEHMPKRRDETRSAREVVLEP